MAPNPKGFSPLPSRPASPVALAALPCPGLPLNLPSQPHSASPSSVLWGSGLPPGLARVRVQQQVHEARDPIPRHDLLERPQRPRCASKPASQACASLGCARLGSSRLFGEAIAGNACLSALLVCAPWPWCWCCPQRSPEGATCSSSWTGPRPRTPCVTCPP